MRLSWSFFLIFFVCLFLGSCWREGGGEQRAARGMGGHKGRALHLVAGAGPRKVPYAGSLHEAVLLHPKVKCSLMKKAQNTNRA